MGRIVRSGAGRPSTGTEDVRTGLSADALTRAVRDHLRYVRGRSSEDATPYDWYEALAYAVRDRLLQRWVRSHETVHKRDVRVVAYLSAEFLLGPHLGNNLVNLGILDEAREAARRLGLDLDGSSREEEEPGLGNGGLGRLAACYLDSLATLEIPAIGYGIRYEFGIFDQDDPRRLAGRDHRQVAARRATPGRSRRPEIACVRRLRRPHRDDDRRRAAGAGSAGSRTGWSRASPTTRRSLGYRVNTANLLRLWKAEACRVVRLPGLQRRRLLRRGRREGRLREHHQGALPERRAGRRQGSCGCEQQYFFVSCSLQDMIRIHLRRGQRARDVPRERSPSSSTTPIPSIARRRADAAARRRARAGLGARPGTITRAHASATRTTRCSPRRSSSWPLALFAALLPRHLEIIYEINRRFLDEVRARFPGDDERRRAACRSSTRAASKSRAHGAPRRGRQPRDQRRRRAAHRAAQADACCATSTSSRRRSSSTSPTASRRGAGSC